MKRKKEPPITTTYLQIKLCRFSIIHKSSVGHRIKSHVGTTSTHNAPQDTITMCVCMSVHSGTRESRNASLSQSRDRFPQTLQSLTGIPASQTHAYIYIYIHGDSYGGSGAQMALDRFTTYTAETKP